MVISERTRKHLRSLGLTEYETEAYLTILEGKEMNASEVSKQSGIPYSRIYDVLKRLAEKGWITIKHETPTRYLAQPPKEAVKLVRQSLLRGLEEAEREINSELQPIYEEQGGAEHSEVMIIHGQDNLFARVLDMINKARKQVFIAFPRLPQDNNRLVYGWIRTLKQRDVKVRLLTNHPPSKKDHVLLDFAEIRIQPGLYGSGMIIDQRETLLALPETRTKAARKASLQWAIWSAHAGLALIASEYFDNLWANALKLSKNN